MKKSDIDIEDFMIRASNNANLTKEKLVTTYEKDGLMGVYNLGLKNMLEYFILKGGE